MRFSQFSADDLQALARKLEAEIYAYLVVCHGRSLSENEWFKKSKDFKSFTSKNATST